MDTPAPAALQSLPYVLPSHPHTGADCSVQTSGFFAHVPVCSAAPHMASIGKLQYSPLGHAAPVRPPQEISPPPPVPASGSCPMPPPHFALAAAFEPFGHSSPT